MLIVTIAAALGGCARQGSEHDLVDVRRDDLVLAVEVTGELEAVDSTDVLPPMIPESSSFKVSWLAAEGVEVKAGEPVATFASDELNRSLESLESDSAEATHRLEKRRQEVALARREDELRVLEAEASARKEQLRTEVPAELTASIDARSQAFDSELSQMSLDQVKQGAELSRHSDEADLHDLIDARANVLRRIESAKRGLTRMTVMAPRTGTVVYTTSYQNGKRKLGDSVYRTEVVVQIVGLDSMIGTGQIDEVDVGRIAAHQPATLRLDAFPDVGLHGTVASLTGSVQARSYADPSKVVGVKIALDPTKGAGLRPGMPFRGLVETSRVPGVIQVPAEAVFVEADGPVAYREAAGGLERVPLVLGRRTAETIEVVSGLAAGDRVSKEAP
jgi:HlyD family secretion protein